MISEKKISCLFICIFLTVIGLILPSAISYSQTIIKLDSVKQYSEVYSTENQKYAATEKSSGNFYKTDSIFSFRSQKGYLPSLVFNLKEDVTAPLHYKTKQWLITGAAIGITASLIYFDEDIDESISPLKEKHNWINNTSPAITQFGGNTGIYTVIAAGLISAAFKNEKGVQTSLLATQAVINSGITCYIIKCITGRERPKAAYIFSQQDGGKWHGPFGRYTQELPYKSSGFAFDAFPSGHTATAFSIATVFASQYKNIKGVPVFCYTAATAVGISRLTEHEHWASDVFVGAILGYLSGKQVVRHFNKIHQKSLTNIQVESKRKTEMTFIQRENQIGLLVKW
jgi:membrane-associated phospholipid phosphatase